PDPGRRWYELRPGPPGAILWSIMHQYRHLAPLNTGATPVNDNLLQITPRIGLDARLLAALLNSHLVGLLKHACGRQRNEGMLKTQAGDVRRLRVPDPRRFDASMRSRLVDAFRAIGSRRICRITDECLLPDRRRLDVAVLEAIGYSPEGAARAAERVAAALISLHGGERLGELDAMAQRRRHAREARHRAVRPRA
ncbi:MAG TPA: hypothetical protein VFP98_01995, partial [Candidatus Polarisedimenticolia bacterium]|nr:hypothetical protein [Candidatus Polarisedimenticolia bacterium]